METTKQEQPGIPTLPAIHPLMPPAEKRALWRKVQALWRQPTTEALTDVERSRQEWDEPSSQH